MKMRERFSTKVGIYAIVGLTNNPFSRHTAASAVMEHFKNSGEIKIFTGDSKTPGKQVLKNTKLKEFCCIFLFSHI